MDTFREALLMFRGMHDLSGFTRGKGRPARLRIDDIQVSRRDDTILVDVRAQRFLRNMVRFMVPAGLDAARRSDLEGIERALSSGRRIPGLAPADPHGLILMDVEYPAVEFRPLRAHI